MTRPRLHPLAFAVALAAADAGAQEAPAVIERGQEELLAVMLGRGAALPGGCAWAGATVEQTRVLSWYTCAGGRVDLELRHSDDAPGAAAKSARFAFREREGAAPPGLVDALVARFREREAGFRWQRQSSSPLSLPSRDDRPLRALGMSLAVFAVLSVPMHLAYRRLAGRAGASPKTRAGAIAGAVLGIALAAGTFAALRAATRAFGEAALATLGTAQGSGVAASLGAMLAWLLLALGAAILSARTPARLGTRARFALGAAIFVGVTYPLSLHGGDFSRFGDLVLGRPNAVSWDTSPGRPRMTYRSNGLGFREPQFEIEKPACTTRIALIGDSYVYGVGVDLDDTLSANLHAELARREPERRLEVLNLGVPGNNLSSHVDMVEAALRLDPDVVILALTLPNDLSRWDVQASRRAAKRPGLFSFARYLFGEAATVFCDAALLETTLTPAGLANLEREIGRLARVRAASPRRPRLLAFSYRELGPSVASRLANCP